MNFFEYQDQSRRNTKLLVFLFVLAVIAIVLAIYFAVMLGIRIYFERLPYERVKAAIAGDDLIFRWWNPKIFLYASSITLSVIFLGSLFKIVQLGHGGSAVAEMLGGRKVDPSTKDPDERKLLNVVEEMAIASGIAVPQVYVLPTEKSINAFAAGFSTSDAAIGVTKGSIGLLNRDELQGVIAHEFSHIFNGDMRLNIRLTGLLHGILLIGATGLYLMRISYYSGRSRSSRDGGAGAIVIAGIALTIIGYVGVFFARMIQSAVSREREFLADASAVQFTRNPNGIAGALKKIGGFSYGALLTSRHTEEVSHMMFGSAVKKSFGDLLATHPPLSQRIKRIDPSFRGNFPSLEVLSQEESDQRSEYHAGVHPGAAAFGGPGTTAITPQDVVMNIGNPTEKHLQFASDFLKQLPLFIADSAREPHGARAVIYSVLLDRDPAIQKKQFEYLQNYAANDVFNETLRIFATILKLGPGARLPLVDLCIPALKQLSRHQYDSFAKNVMELIKADQKITLFELTLTKIMLKNLQAQFDGKPRKPKIKHRSLSGLESDCRVLISALAYAGQVGSDDAQKAFESGFRRLWPRGHEISQPERTDILSLNRHLNRLAEAAPSLKREVLEACVATVAWDEKVTVEEGELLRAVGASLDCPIPPIL